MYPSFFVENIPANGSLITMPQEASRHMLTVMRMREGDIISLTNGKGLVSEATISETGKKNCSVIIKSINLLPEPVRKICLAVSLLKNASRFEWMLEKATEIGVGSIIPLICERTERLHFRSDRLKSILISAMLQSQQAWLPEMSEPVKFSSLFGMIHSGQKYIAHCLPGEKQPLSKVLSTNNATILIGPEGDFTKHEIDLALQNDFEPVSLGDTRLRTETAGIVATALLANL